MRPKELRLSIPQYFRCPISLELMRDPVALSTGQTYDRSSIERWLADGNLSCPVTRQPLQDVSVVPNSMLLRLIQAWCVAHKSYGVERVPTPKQPATPQQVAALSQEVSSGHSQQSRADASRRLKILAKESEKNRILMSEMGVAKVLMSSVFGVLDDAAEISRDNHEASVSEEALGALVLLPLDKCGVMCLSHEQPLRHVSRFLNHGAMDSRINAGCLIESLMSWEGATDQLRDLVGGIEGIMVGVVRLLQEWDLSRAMKVGIKALFGMCLSPRNRERAVATGAASAMVECLLMAVGRVDIERGLATLELLCKTGVGRDMVAGHALSIPMLGKMVLKVSDQASENVAGVLLAICESSETAQEEAMEAGMFLKMLMLLQSKCTSRAKKKARNVLKILRENWPDHPCIQVPDGTDVMLF